MPLRDLELPSDLNPLAEMVVAPSTYGILKDPLVTNTTLSREDVRSLPQLGEDLFRAVDRLPGISTNDFTARLYIRGAGGTRSSPSSTAWSYTSPIT